MVVQTWTGLLQGLMMYGDDVDDRRGQAASRSELAPVKRRPGTNGDDVARLGDGVGYAVISTQGNGPNAEGMDIVTYVVPAKRVWLLLPAPGRRIVINGICCFICHQHT